MEDTELDYKQTIEDILNDCNLSESNDIDEKESLLPRSQPVIFSETVLYKLLTHPSRENLRTALPVIERMEPHELQASADDGANFLHILIKVAPIIYELNGSVSPAIPVLYRLATAGLDVNQRTAQGNTLLHLAAVRPEATEFVQHLIRIGVDPALANNRQCTAFYVYSKHSCQLLKTENVVPSGVWRAVCGENFSDMQKLICFSWTRVSCFRDDLSLIYCAGETGNTKVVDYVQKFQLRNELIMYALACDTWKLGKMLSTCSDAEIQSFVNAVDESFSPPKPLVAFLREFGEDISGDVLDLIRRHSGFEENGPLPIDEAYLAELDKLKNAFEDSEFYKKVMNGDAASLDEALELISNGNANVLLRSQQVDFEGWTYLHLVADKWRSIESNRNPVLQRRYIRLVYRLSLAGIDVNARNANNETALMKAFDIDDPTMALHLLRCGADGSVAAPGGVVVGIERYQYQGRLVARAGLRPKDVAGLWAAVEAGDVERTERWLSAWCRVNAVRDDRTVLDVARTLGNKKIIEMLEKHRHTTELVCTALACDVEKVKLLLALGKRMCNLNPVDNNHYVGLLPKRCRIETISRPFIVTAMEVCTPPIVAMLVKFGANLDHFYEEAAPCGPVAFWAFRAGIDPSVTMVVAESALLSLRDERGCSLLHRAMTKPEQETKKEIVDVLINRGIDISLRDIDGSTARDYVTIYDIPDGDALRALIDLHVLDLAVKGKLDYLENLVLLGYDHILSIRGPPKNRTITEHVTLKNLTDIREFLDEIPLIEKDIEAVQAAAATGNIGLLARCTEKISIYGKDKGGRTLLHKAVLWEQENIIEFVVQQLPQIINITDNLNRSALHYCACLPLPSRKRLWPLLGSKTNGCNLSIVDVNNMTAADYVKEMDNETPLEAKHRGKQVYNYRVQTVLEDERAKRYGHVYEVYLAYHALWDHLNKPGIVDGDQQLVDIGKSCIGSYNDAYWNGRLLFKCIELKMTDNALLLWRQLQASLSPEALKEELYTLAIMVQERVRTAQRAAQPGNRRQGGRDKAQQQQTSQMQEVRKEIKTSLLDAAVHNRLMLLENVWREYIAEVEAAKAEEAKGAVNEPATVTVSLGTQTEQVAPNHGAQNQATPPVVA